MKFGLCGSMNDKDGSGIAVADIVKRAGYDYLELSLSHIARLEERELATLENKLQRLDLPCESCNNFFPASIRLTGSEADHGAAFRYAATTLRRAAMLGAKIVVFGSSGAKNVPAGFPHEVAWLQIANLLKGLHPIAEENGIVIAIEPLNRKESNIINTAEEGIQMVREVNRKNIRLLVDYYHLAMEGGTPDAIDGIGDPLVHCHIAEPAGRRFPDAAGKEKYAGFFAALKRVSYGGRLSVEALSDDFERDANESLVLLKELAGA